MEHIEIYKKNNHKQIFGTLGKENGKDITIVTFLTKKYSVAYTLYGHLKEFSLRGLLKFIDGQYKDVGRLVLCNSIETFEWVNPFFLGEHFAKKFHRELSV